jgi:hypothetical protein
VKELVSLVAYRVELPHSLVGVHTVFHMSMLRKCAVRSSIIGLQTSYQRSYLGFLSVVGIQTSHICGQSKWLVRYGV